MTQKLALFDLDHTLIPMDSDYEWNSFTSTLGWHDPVEFNRRNDAFYEQYKAGTLDIFEYVHFATEALRMQGLAHGDPAFLRPQFVVARGGGEQHRVRPLRIRRW